MRRLFLWVIVALLGGVGLVALIESDPGYVLLSYQNFILETSIWVGLFLLFLLNLVVYGLLRLLRRLMASRGYLSLWLGDRRLARGRRLTSLGLINYMEGNWARASRELVRAAEDSDSPAVNYLLAARASRANAENDKAERYLAAAERIDAKAAKAVGLSRAELLLESGQTAAAVQVLERLRDASPKDTRILGMLVRALHGMADWKNLQPLLTEARKFELFAEPEQQALEMATFTGLLHGIDNDAAALEQLWRYSPDAVRGDPGFVAAYCARALAAGDIAPVDKLLRRTLQQQWHPELVRLYGMLPAEDPGKRLASAERWLKQHPNDADLLLCLGRLSLSNKLWGQAREYFEKSLKVRPDAECSAELARLLFSLGMREKSAQAYRDGLLCDYKLPDLPQPKAGQL
jgi:HemY protein